MTLQSWYTKQLQAPYERLINDENETDKQTSNRPTSFDKQ